MDVIVNQHQNRRGVLVSQTFDSVPILNGERYGEKTQGRK
jgi:hypothetical protein